MKIRGNPSLQGGGLLITAACKRMRYSGVALRNKRFGFKLTHIPQCLAPTYNLYFTQLQSALILSKFEF